MYSKKQSRRSRSHFNSSCNRCAFYLELKTFTYLFVCAKFGTHYLEGKFESETSFFIFFVGSIKKLSFTLALIERETNPEGNSQVCPMYQESLFRDTVQHGKYFYNKRNSDKAQTKMLLVFERPNQPKINIQVK